ncbi:hypothetical protein SAMN04488571_1138 [Methanoculleus thermophilus]|jgi:hypothetical protein|uniref:Uncharacterized protein n=2 Tax=Methanomicrobiaceae TaxID=2194 RepID=A0A1G9C7C1_9EURY|nr:hypothetical protein SAMN04488571_1138 [Methanoculleus thermophilus]
MTLIRFSRTNSFREAFNIGAIVAAILVEPFAAVFVTRYYILIYDSAAAPA